MNGRFSLVLAAVLAVSTTACGPGSKPLPPEQSLTVPPDESAADAPDPGAGARAAVPAAPAPGSRYIPDRWRKAGASSAQVRQDTEDCYNYAWSQVRNDVRIDRDIAAARGEYGSEYNRITGLTRSIDDYYYKRERGTRLASCMRDKGYSRD